jgi:REP element-mobilizing transposase RayT
MKGQLPRLQAEHYRGRAYVFWTHTTDRRERFPLDACFHFNFREILLHTCLRYRLATPVYCIMPDHIHLLWIGLDAGSDQRKACSFLRKYFGQRMAPVRWQQQAHDHVVCEDERQSGQYADTINYILQNPVRAGLVEKWQDYSYLGAMLSGYPDLDRRDAGFHERFWGLVERESR